MKKMMSLVLSLLLCCTFITFAGAESGEKTSIEQTKTAIITALRSIEVIKDSYGLEESNFSSISMGDKFVAYEYVEGGFTEVYRFYPLFEEEALIAIAMTTDEENYQIDTAIVDEINAIDVEQFALVYDNAYAYLYDGTEFYVLSAFGEVVERRMQLPENKDGLDISELQISVLCPFSELGYTPIRTRASYANCSVSYVTQNPYDSLCWAASIACVVNARTGSNLTARTVAVAEFGSTNFNQGRTNEQIAWILSTRYELAHVVDYSLTESEMYSYIGNGYPVIGQFSVSNGNYHAVVIHYVDIESGRIGVMDPEVGFVSAYFVGSAYEYTRTSTGVTLTLIAGVRPGV